MIDFVIFSLARCGSTSLAEALNAARPGMCAMEPFNPHASGPFARDTAVASGLKVALRMLGSEWRGIKHVWHPAGWPFPQPDLNYELMASPHVRVIFMYRKNILRRLVSEEIAKQTGQWRYNPRVQAKLKSMEFRRIDIEKTHLGIDRERELLEACKSHLTCSGTEWIDVQFENLFGDGSTPALDRIAALLDLPFELSLPRREFDGAKLYERIPNAWELEESLGHHSTGFLFR